MIRYQGRRTICRVFQCWPNYIELIKIQLSKLLAKFTIVLFYQLQLDFYNKDEVSMNHTKDGNFKRYSSNDTTRDIFVFLFYRIAKNERKSSKICEIWNDVLAYYLCAINGSIDFILSVFNSIGNCRIFNWRN